MPTDFSQLSLDPVEIRDNLRDLGIDDSLLSDSELTSLMSVSDIVLRGAIARKSSEIETQLLDYQLQADKVSALNKAFGTIYQQIASDDATAGDLMTAIETDYTIIATGNTASMGISYSETVETGYYAGRTAEYDSVSDYIAAVDANAQVDGGSWLTISALEWLRGIETGVLTDKLVNSSGAEFTGTLADQSREWVAGNGYVELSRTTADHVGNIKHVYIGYDGYRKYLIAKALQDAGYIGADVMVDPLLFAEPTATLNSDVSEWLEWHRLYSGQVTIDYDVGDGALTVDYNGTAALRAMGLDPDQYFEPAALDVTLTYTPLEAQDTRYAYRSEHLTDISDRVKYAFLPEAPSMFLLLTGARTHDKVTDFVRVSWFEFDRYIEIQHISWVLKTAIPEPNTWSAMSIEDLTDERYMTSELSSLFEDMGGAVEGEAATSELALLVASTAITEWSELHNSWDTVHRYVTDAIERAVRFMK